jgi:hypothetical protein
MSEQGKIVVGDRFEKFISYSQWFLIPLFMFYLQYKIMKLMELRSNDASGLFNMNLVTFMILYNVLSTIMIWINEFIRKENIGSKWYHSLAYIFPVIIWFLLLFTLVLSNIKRVSGLASAPENTINIIIWLSIILVIIQTATKRYLYLETDESIQQKPLTYYLYETWFPITSFAIITLVLLSTLFISNNKFSQNLVGFFLPLLVSSIIAIVSVVLTNKPS